MPGKSKKKFISLCPKCHSTDVGADFSNVVAVRMGLLNNSKVCHNWGYSGSIFPEAESDNLPKVKKIKNERKRYKQNIRMRGPSTI